MMDEHVNCANCGIQFCMPSPLATTRREDHGSFYCPNGHSNFWPGKTEQEEKLERLERWNGQLESENVRDEPGRAEWQTPIGGLCACGCEQWAPRLERHHVLLESLVRREGGNPWSFANSMLVHEHCHRNHHDKFRRFSFDAVPVVAVEFAVDLLGDELAAMYFARHYGFDGETT
jgi:hypothetical protein